MCAAQLLPDLKAKSKKFRALKEVAATQEIGEPSCRPKLLNSPATGSSSAAAAAAAAPARGRDGLAGGAVVSGAQTAPIVVRSRLGCDSSAVVAAADDLHLVDAGVVLLAVVQVGVHVGGVGQEEPVRACMHEREH